MPKVLVLDQVHPDGVALLQASPEVETVYLPAPDDAAIAREIRDAEAIVLRARVLSRAVLDSAPKLRLISRHGVGCDNLDLPYLKSRGIAVAIAADSNYISVAEQAFALMLAGCKRLVAADAAVRSGNWDLRDNLNAREVMGAGVLVAGFGRIGRAFAERARAFGAHVTVYDPFMPEDAPLPNGVRRQADLQQALAAADIVSLHMPRTPETAMLFNADRLRQMKPGAILVNTARGGIVDETALPVAFAEGRPAIYATDVLEQEPPRAGEPLLSSDQLIVTPHSAAMTQEGARRMATRSCQNVLDYFSDALDPDMVAG